jgi:hypothetical protein
VWSTPSDGDAPDVALGQTWTWNQVAGDTLPIFFLEAGTYTLTLQPQGSGMKLDRFLITNDLEYRPE